MLLATILLLVATTPCAGGGESLLPQLARVEVLEGRATLASGPRLRSLDARSGPLDGIAPSYLETSPLARASLRWSGAASLDLRGATSLEWSAPSAGRALEWRLFHFGEVHFEVRRGPVKVELPGGWSALVENAAVYVGELPSGGFALHHDAGLPILLSPPCVPTRARPPLTVLAGARLTFAPGDARPRPSGVVSASRLLDPFGREEAAALERAIAPPWKGFSWPWTGASDAASRASDVQRSAETRTPAAHDPAQDASVEPEHPSVPRQSSSLRPVP